jgi:hypothetical protein
MMAVADTMDIVACPVCTAKLGELCRVLLKRPHLERITAAQHAHAAAYAVVGDEDANGYLIAAAPDLLAACIAMVADIEKRAGNGQDNLPPVGKLLAAIRKARGGS